MRKLAIVGSHSLTCALAPYDDPDYEIWVFNEAPQNAPGMGDGKPQFEWCKRWDVDFQMHKPEVYMSHNNMVKRNHWEWLQENHGKKTIYMQEYDELVPNSRRYPLEEICETVGKRRMITSTPEYALALALYQGRKEIHVWGVELTSNTEYSYQLNGWMYWVGVADGMGVDLVLHSGEVHFQSKLYAYEGEIQIDRDFFKKRAASLEEDWHFAESALRKAIERLDNAITDRDFDKIADLSIKAQDAALVCGEFAGCLAEANNYAARLDPITRQEFERRSATGQNFTEQKRVLMYHEGGKVEYVYNIWKQKQSLEARDQMRKFMQQQQRLAYETGANIGIYRENGSYMNEYDARLTAAGGERTLKALTPQGV